jgi:DNA-binding CsgD family transcriptional regulator
MDLSLTDRIYECAFAPELWPDVLDEFAKIADAFGGLLIAVNGETISPTVPASKTLVAMTQQYIAGYEHLYGQGPASRRLLTSLHLGFIRDSDVMTDEEIENDPLYRELLWPAGMGNAAGTTISAGTGDMLMCILVRERVKGPVTPAQVQQLDALRPHLARSVLMSARLHLERARVATETLNLLGLPALVFGFDGRVVAANALIEAETDHIRWRARDRLTLTDKTANEMLQRAFESLGDDIRASVRSFPVRDTGSVAAKVAHVVPLRGVSRDIFTRSAGVLMLTPVGRPTAPSAQLIQSLFDLTPAEAALARNLTSGQTLNGIALAGGVSTNTVRTQLRAVLGKTGCSRQAEVVALLSGLATPGA